MARIRTIKPDAFTSHSLSLVPRGVRWTFAGLWTYADDDGRARDDVRLIKAALYPIDDEVSLTMLAEDLELLNKVGCICRYEVNGRYYLHMPNWQHQVINRPSPSKLPACPQHPVENPVDERSVRTHGRLTERSRQERKGKEQGTGKGKDVARKRATQLPADWKPNDTHWRIATDMELDLGRELSQFVDHHTAKGSVFKDWDAALRTWLRNAGKWGNTTRNPNGNVIDWDAAMARAEARDQA